MIRPLTAEAQRGMCRRSQDLLKGKMWAQEGKALPRETPSLTPYGAVSLQRQPSQPGLGRESGQVLTPPRSRTTPHPTCPLPPPAVPSSSLLPSQATRVCDFLPHLPSGTCCPRLWSCPQGHVAGPCPWPPCCPHTWRRSGVLRLNQCLAVCGCSLSPRTMLKVWQKG